MEYDYDDIYELEADSAYKNTKTPAQIMEYQLNIVHNGNWKAYLASIEWDVYKLPSKKELADEIREAELKKHPFKKYF